MGWQLKVLGRHCETGQSRYAVRVSRIALFIFLFLSSVRAELLTKEEMTQNLETAESLPDSEARANLVSAWKESLSFLERTEQAKGVAAGFAQRLAELEEILPLSLPEKPAGAVGLEQLVSWRDEIRAALESSENRLTAMKRIPAESAERLEALGVDLAESRRALAALETGAGRVDDARSADQVLKASQRGFLEATIEAIQAEIAFEQRRRVTHQDRLSQRRAQIESLEEFKEQAEEDIEKIRLSEAVETESSLEKARQDFRNYPEVGALLDEIEDFSQRLVDPDLLQKQKGEAAAFADKVSDLRGRIIEQASDARERIELLQEAGLGVDTETGLSLRQQRALLPRTSELADEMREQVKEGAKVQIQYLNLSDQRLPLSEARVREISEVSPDLDSELLLTLIDKRGELHRSLLTEYDQLKKTLIRGTTEARATITEIDNYSSYLDERLLWIKSARPLSLQEPRDEWARIKRLFSPEKSERVLRSLGSAFLVNPLLNIILLLFFSGMFFRRGHLRKSLAPLGDAAVRRNCTSIVPTVQAIGISILLAAAVPASLLLVSNLLSDHQDLAGGCRNLAIFLFFGQLIKSLCRKEGLFVRHLKVKEMAAARVYSALSWFMLAVSPFVFLVAALVDPEGDTGAGRLVFVCGMLVLAFFNHTLFRPKVSILGSPGGVTIKDRIVYLLTVGTPIGFAIGAGLGYFVSVLKLRSETMATVGLLILAFLLIRFFTRWVLVSRRKLAIKQALRRREAALAERARQVEGAEDQGEVLTLDEVKAQAVDVVEVEAQTTQLVRVLSYITVLFGVWFIWSGSLKALSGLDRIELWGGSATAGQVEADTSSSPTQLLSVPSAAEPASEPTASEIPVIGKLVDDFVSLQDLLVAIFVSFMTFIAARNIPSLLSLTVFSRFNLGPGGNFALTTTLRYLIVLIGVVTALSLIGITWGKVQWLAAAITLGIGFGLQEIFANFVAGIIILFERPIRLGDVVTVGDVSGKVTQIEIRATTIQQFNNRELLVPNKEFITSQLVNWTLRDSILRFEVPVGIAYGSDTKLAKQVLEKILKDHPKVLADPPPDVLFNAFGASTLDFNVRGFVCSVADLIFVKSEIHFLIDDAFREAEIEIAFPQQDIHIRTLPDELKSRIDL